MKKTHLEDLLGLIVSARTKKDAEVLLYDLLTATEREAVVQRLQIVKLIAKGVTHRKISADLGVSISKVTRGSQALKVSKGLFKRLCK